MKSPGRRLSDIGQPRLYDFAQARKWVIEMMVLVMADTGQPISDRIALHSPFGDEAVLVGRWFAGGQSCDIFLTFRRPAP